MVTLVSPCTEEDDWFKGNLHTHTTETDGAESVGDVIAAYQRHGHDFLAISDHDTFVAPDGYRDRTETALLPAVEVSVKGPHLHHVNASKAIPPVEDRQTVIDVILDAGGMAILNHPNWQSEFSHWSQDRLTGLTGYLGIEIYNGLVEWHPGAATATDRWDQFLSAGRHVWRFANDHSHREEDVGRGWNVVQAAELTPESIIESLSAGRFYASTGVSIESIDVKDTTLTIVTDDAARIRLISDHGVVQQTVDGLTASSRVLDQLVHRSAHTYVRLECVGRAGEMAWTQPLFLKE